MGLSRPGDLSAVELLLYELCSRLGYCLPQEAQEELVSNPPRGVEAFTDAVIIAEGLDPATLEKRLRLQVRDCVAKYLPGT